MTTEALTEFEVAWREWLAVGSHQVDYPWGEAFKAGWNAGRAEPDEAAREAIIELMKEAMDADFRMQSGVFPDFGSLARAAYEASHP